VEQAETQLSVVVPIEEEEVINYIKEKVKSSIENTTFIICLKVSD
jgi:hypothetical protein